MTREPGEACARPKCGHCFEHHGSRSCFGDGPSGGLDCDCSAFIGAQAGALARAFQIAEELSGEGLALEKQIDALGAEVAEATRLIERIVWLYDHAAIKGYINDTMLKTCLERMRAFIAREAIVRGKTGGAK